MLPRLSAPLVALLARGVAQYADDGNIDLFLEPAEVAEGGMITISMWVPVTCARCAGRGCEHCKQGSVDDLFAAWLAVRPGVADGTILTPSAWLPNMTQKVYFRVRLAPAPGGGTV